jgi:HAD superfamily hydrolase (TIGR01484 family)
MKQYESILFDLDGTLAISKGAIDAEMASLVSKATQSLAIAIITGGTFNQIKKQVIDNLLPRAHLESLYILPTTGATMVAYQSATNTWDTVYQHRLSDAQKKRIITGINNALAKASFTINPDDIKGEQIEDRQSQITFSALGQEQLPEIKKAWDPDYRKRRELVELLSELNDTCSVNYGGTTSIDITLAGIDKAFGIQQFYKHTEYDMSTGLFVGDEIKEGGNDYAATTTAIDVLPTTGPEETKKIIQEVLKTSKDKV